MTPTFAFAMAVVVLKLIAISVRVTEADATKPIATTKAASVWIALETASPWTAVARRVKMDNALKPMLTMVSAAKVELASKANAPQQLLVHLVPMIVIHV
jgi:hypothetical protein